MTVTRATSPAPPAATAVLLRLLRQLGCAPTGVTADVTWAGPVRLPLVDEAGVQAACGLMHIHGRRDGHPVPLAMDVAASVAGILAAHGVVAALIARARGLPLTAVRTSASQAALLLAAQYLAADNAADAVPAPGPGLPPPFVSADGVRFEIETLDAEPWQRFWRILGAGPEAIRHGWPPFQLRFGTATCPLPPELHEIATGRPFARVLAAGTASGVVVMRVRETPGLAPESAPWRFEPLAGTSRQSYHRPRELPLEGIVVVESARRVQGPLAGHLLRMLGADVVRVEPPGGDPLRWPPPLAGDCSARFRAINDGKRVAEADFTTAAGRARLCELVAGADVFLHNWAPGKAQALGLDAADLNRVRPGLVYAAAGGWGPEPGAGPKIATDYVVQAQSGLAAAIRPQGEPPAPTLLTLADLLGGLVCALGVLGALHTRIRTGIGSRTDSSLLSATAALPRSPVRPVWTDLDRPLRTADGYLMLSRVARPALGAGQAVLRGARQRSTAEVLRQLAEAGLPAVPVCTDLRQLAADWRFEQALEITGDAAGGRMVSVRPPWEFW
ncbi:MULTISPECIES: CoA transferase [Amycolatopsis]|uniref:CoA transferase n=1 Tax=Amycolatopsis TaxID=1813 RepID=UPI001E4A831E|nr:MULTISPECIES: CoA transferase [Amycolatopsis]